MRPQDIKLNETYRLRTNPNYSYVKVIEKLNPKQKENDKNYIIFKCEHTINKNDSFGMIKYFRPCDLIK